MALIKFGGGVVQMSGSIAGDTFARNKYGNYSRARTTPVNPNSSRQQQMRSIIAALTTYWSATCSQAQRDAWALYASNVSMLNKLGETINLSGFNHFIRSNSPRLQVATNWVAAGPTTFELPAKDPTFAISISEATQLISVTFNTGLSWVSEDSAFLSVYMGLPQNPQRTFFGGPWRLAFNIWGNAGAPPASPQTGAVPWVVTEGQHIWCYARISRADARLSEAMRDDCFCGA